MYRYLKIMAAFVLIAVLAMGGSGCLSVKADDLYRLPQASEEYLKLQEQIDIVLSSGAEFSPPAGGPNRQSVQIKDLNGDFINEAVVFFSVPADGTLKTYIYEISGDDYAVADIIEGVGTAFESVRFADMDNDGVMELIVGRQMGASLRHMSIYSLRDFSSVLLASADYSTITVSDLNGTHGDEVVVMRLPASDSQATAEVFNLMPDGEIVSAVVSLSNGLEMFSRVMTSNLLDGTAAVFIEGEGKFDDGTLVTDICAYNRDGVFSNITLDRFTGVSGSTVRTRSIYSTDINKDGVLEVPAPRLLKAQSDTPYFATDWYAFSSYGGHRLALTTYHNNFDGWYLILPFDWRGKVSVRREDAVPGERTVVFSYITESNGTFSDFLKIHMLTGDNREERVKLSGRREILNEGVAIYAFELLSEPNSYGLTLTEETIIQNFSLIYTDWITGAVQ